MKRSSPSALTVSLSAIFIFAVLGYQLYSKYQRDTYAKQTYGVITSVKHIDFGSKSWINYTFNVNGLKYDSSTKCSYRVEGHIGDSCLVEYSYKDPDNSNLVRDSKKRIITSSPSTLGDAQSPFE